MALETVLFLGAIILFGIWLAGAAVGTWAPYCIVLVVLLEVGSHLLDANRIKTLKRIREGDWLKSLANEADAMDRMFHNELALYIPVPTGLIVATILCLIRKWGPETTIAFSVNFVLILGAAVLAYFLLVAFLRMSDPLLVIGDLPSPNVTKEERRGWVDKIGKSLRLLLSPKKDEAPEDQKKREIDVACAVADLLSAIV